MKLADINRKEFLKRAGLLAGAVALPMRLCRATVCGDVSADPALPRTGGKYRVAGLPGRNYNQGFKKLCRYGRFESFEDALASVRSPETEFLVICD